MSLYHPRQTATILQDAQTSDEIDLQNECDFVRLELTAMDSCTVSLTAADESAGTFRAVGVATASTATTTGDCFTYLFCSGCRFIKVVASAAQTTDDVTIVAMGIKN